MNKEELEKNLGTIAKSGSLDFKTEVEKKDEIDIIGQFGVGFYSAFMVSEQVTVRSKAYGEEEAFQWESTGADGYSIEACEKEANGTEIILTLKEDTEAVSYTHLDVYKRQREKSAALCWIRLLFMQKAAGRQETGVSYAMIPLWVK